MRTVAHRVNLFSLVRILYQLSLKSSTELQNLALFSTFSGVKLGTEFYVRKTYIMV